MNTAGDTLQPSRAVEHGVQAGNIGQQHLGGTDIRVRFPRRICCSRVSIAMRSAVLPAASFDTPIIRPGMERLTHLLRQKTPRAGRRSPSVRRSAGRSQTQCPRPACPGSQQNQGHKIGRDADNHFARFQVSYQFAVIVNLAGGATCCSSTPKTS